MNHAGAQQLMDAILDNTCYSKTSSKIEVSMYVRSSKPEKITTNEWDGGGDWSQQVEHVCKFQINGTGPGVRRSKRPLSACHSRCKCIRIQFNVSNISINVK